MRSLSVVAVVVTAVSVAVGAPLAGLVLAGCPGAQVKSPIPLGDVDVVIRRIDVVRGGFDAVDVRVVLAVGNGTANDLDVGAELDLAIVGPGRDEGDGSGGGAEADSTEADSTEADSTEAESGESGHGEGVADDSAGDIEQQLSTPTDGLDGRRHAGRASGTARAQNTSELLVPITVPLPTDTEVLDRVLGWPRARVLVRGKVRIGLMEKAISGERDMATPKLPELRLKNPQIARADEGAAGEAFITLLVENKNPFAVDIEKLNWDIAIAGKTLRTKEDGNAQLQASSIDEYNESIVIDANAFPPKELKALLKKPAVPYVVRGSLEVRGIRRDFHFDGEMQFPR